MDKQVTDAQTKDQDLEKARVEVGEQLTTEQAIPVKSDRNSLHAGERGPTLLEDFALREKITHFDHERIPERVVHARGAAAHGYFQVYKDLSDLTAAKFLQNPNAQTPVFVRFSTVAGSRGSADTARDVRGFAVKFYTEEGNFDLVGNNMPVFFIQDAIKFPDLIHAAKGEPHNEIPQASTAHDTFWDFISLTPESMHMIMWTMSDRAIPRSYRMMEGFGVHAFRLVNAQGQSCFVKFHWKPILGLHSLVWDEAQKLAGKDPDFHRRDLWEAIEQGSYVEYELGLQILEEKDELKYDFDILDSTKLWPEDLIPVQRVGKMTLNRNPDNYFAETEQVAFHTANMVPGIDFSNDPLLQGRLFSYLDTQLLRLGGPNFAQIPINRPIAPVASNQRDGFQQHYIHKGRVSYEPNSLSDNLPAPSATGFSSYPQRMEGPKVRERSESFGDHFGQAKLFWNSMSPIEQKHISSALQFELSKVETKAIRQRMLAHLFQINETLGSQVAVAIGEKDLNGVVNKPAGNATRPNGGSAVSKTSASGGLERSSGLSMEETPKDSIKSRKVAVLVAEGVNVEQIEALKKALTAEGAQAQIVANHLGTIGNSGGQSVMVDKTFANSGSVVFDAVFVPGGEQSINTLMQQDSVRHFVAEAYKHGKTIGLLGEAVKLQTAINPKKPNTSNTVSAELGVVTSSKGSDAQAVISQFIANFKQQRHWGRSMEQELPE